jgi:Resolvase, N terminal domain/Homeodomain-like domain
MRMALVVILEPGRQLRQDRLGIRTIVNIHVIPFKGFDECFRHAIGLRAAHRCEARNQAQADREVDRSMGAVTTAVIGEPLDRVRQARGAKPPLDALEHQIPDHLSADAAGARTPGHDLSIAGIQRKGHADHLTVPACDLEAVRGPAQVRPDRNDQAWGVSLVAQTGLQFDLRSAQGKLIASLMAALAEFERHLLRERVRSGIAAAQKRGVVFGRRPGQRIKADRFAPKVLKLVSEGQSYREISHRLGLSKNTVLDIVKRDRAA